MGGGIVSVSGAKAERRSKGDEPRTLVISANAFWNITNFRSGLIAALSAAGYRVVIAVPDADKKWADVHGLETASISIDRSGMNPLRDAFLFGTYVRLMGRLRPAAFLGFTVKPNVYGSLAAHWHGAPALPNVSGLGTAFINPGPLSTLVGGLYRLAFRKCRIVFFQNAEDRDLFVDRKIVRLGQTRLLPGSGVDLDRFSPAEPSTETRFLYVGRLLGDKGVRDFVEAARLLRPRHGNWKFQLLGSLDEDNRSSITRQELEQWLAEGCIEHLAQVEDVRPHIAASSAVVLPSYREGLPRSLLEAAAMARPLIGTNVPGIRQLIIPGTNGLLCAVRDPLDLASAMEKIGNMPASERRAMGHNARAMVEREFGEAEIFRAYLEALEELCSPGRS